MKYVKDKIVKDIFNAFYKQIQEMFPVLNINRGYIDWIDGKRYEFPEYTHEGEFSGSIKERACSAGEAAARLGEVIIKAIGVRHGVFVWRVEPEVSEADDDKGGFSAYARFNILPIPESK